MHKQAQQQPCARGGLRAAGQQLDHPVQPQQQQVIRQQEQKIAVLCAVDPQLPAVTQKIEDDLYNDQHPRQVQYQVDRLPHGLFLPFSRTNHHIIFLHICIA